MCLGQLGGRVARRHDAAACHQASTAPIRRELSAADGDGPGAIAVSIDPTDRTAVATPRETFVGGDPEGYRRRLRENYPQGARARFLRPEEVADLIFYLAQPRAAGITGANVSIDFGLSAGI